VADSTAFVRALLGRQRLESRVAPVPTVLVSQRRAGSTVRVHRTVVSVAVRFVGSLLERAWAIVSRSSSSSSLEIERSRSALLEQHHTRSVFTAGHATTQMERAAASTVERVTSVVALQPLTVAAVVPLLGRAEQPRAKEHFPAVTTVVRRAPPAPSAAADRGDRHAAPAAAAVVTLPGAAERGAVTLAADRAGLDRLTDHVLRAIDRRLIAQRERLGVP
jgi:hypothetical protein